MAECGRRGPDGRDDGHEGHPAAPDKVTVVASGITVRGRLVVDKTGGLVLVTTYPAGFSDPIDILRPGPTQPLRFTSIILRSTGATVTATLDPSFFGG